jgi:hypothetical protein
VFIGATYAKVKQIFTFDSIASPMDEQHGSPPTDFMEYELCLISSHATLAMRAGRGATINVSYSENLDLSALLSVFVM